MSFSKGIAIVGIGGIFPGARDLDDFWRGIAAGESQAKEPPTGRWLLPADQAYSPTLRPDKIASKRACFVENFELDSTGLDIDRELLSALDPMFHLGLHAAREAWADAKTDNLDKRRVGVIIGNIALPTDASSAIADEILGPAFEASLFGRPIAPSIKKTELLNRYVAGLPGGVIAKALGLGGGAYTLDAACASSLYSLKLAAGELTSGRADAVIAGGLSRPDSLYTQMGFTQLRALSPSGTCSPFDLKADGLVVGEGAGMFVLKRLDDALAAGDYIYGAICGIGLSNDLGGSLMSPDSEGQLRAMRAAYKEAGWAPSDVDLIECHGTGTPIGDAVEFNSLRELWGPQTPAQAPHQNPPQDPNARCVIGSVKSNVGHLLTGAGAAGLMKTLLAMKRGELPPTANFSSPSNNFDMKNSPFTVLDKTREWRRRTKNAPRRAAVSAFGFGGINAHVLIEEWLPETEAETKRRTQIFTDFETRPASENSDPIVVVGMAATFGPWKELLSLQERMLGGNSETQPQSPKNWRGVPTGNVKGFFIDDFEMPLGKYRIPPAELKDMLPQQLLMLKTAGEALADAGLDHAETRLRAGVFIGMGLDLNTTNFHFRWSMHKRAPEWARAKDLDYDEPAPGHDMDQWIEELKDAAGPPLTANRTMGALGGIVASRVARAFKVGGPSFTVSSEETSGLHALEVGVRALQRGDIDMAMVGAVDLAGDPKAALGQADRRPYSAKGVARPFDEQADGAVVGEGSACLILMRKSDAEIEGRKILAIIKGMGKALDKFGNGADSLVPSEQAYFDALDKALKDAEVSPSSISCHFAHGSGNAAEDRMEALALADFYGEAGQNGQSRLVALASTAADIGHAGAASSLASAVKAIACLQHNMIPPLRNHAAALSRLQEPGSRFFAPTATQYWIRDRIDGPRRAAVSSMGVDGNCVSAVIEEWEAPKTDDATDSNQRLHTESNSSISGNEGLFVVSASDPQRLQDQLQTLLSFSKNKHDLGMETLAKRWRMESKEYDPNKCNAAIVCESLQGLRSGVNAALGAIKDGRQIASDNVFYSPEPLAKLGQLALVFPGAGTQFTGMGRALAAKWPRVLRRLDRENQRLASQFMADNFWKTENIQGLSQRDSILAIVSAGAFVSDLIADFGVKPDAMIGYCLGESTSLFAAHCWNDRDGMLQKMHESPLFHTDLAGPYDAARKAWGVPAGQQADWRSGILNVSAEKVAEAIKTKGRSRVYLLIVSAPGECVVGGQGDEVERLVKDLGCEFRQLPGISSVHCEIAKEVEKKYWDLHYFADTSPSKLKIYSAAWGKPYEATPDSAAKSIVEQSLHTFDFTKLIEKAYADGIRLFVEVGPGASCCRMISKILGDRPHMARSACAAGGGEVGNMLRLLGRLIGEGVQVDLDKVPGLDGKNIAMETKRKEPFISIETGGKTFAPPSPPFPKSPFSKEPETIGRIIATPIKDTTEKDATKKSSNGTSAHTTMQRDDSKRQPPTTSPKADDQRRLDPILSQTLTTETARAEAHQAFLKLSQSLNKTMGDALGLQLSILNSSPYALPDNQTVWPRVAPSAQEPAPPIQKSEPIETQGPRAGINLSPNIALNRAQCMEFAIGKIANVLGPKFAPIDAYPTRVRLPDEPLMLVDRIMRIEGEPLSMTSGRVVTEHDVLPGAWYLDCGRIPTCIAVEAGQADLFLSGWLGIDFQAKGQAVYRLLDAEVEFHGPLPCPGAVINYDIHIDHFFRQGDTYLFKFYFEGTINGEQFLTMRNGCAGFFSQAELDAGRGVIMTEMDKRPMPASLPEDWIELAPMPKANIETYNDAQVAALRRGDLTGCFGEAFAGLRLSRPVGLPGGKMTLVHRVLRFDPKAGRYGLGQIVGEADVRPDDWYLLCHFIDDRVMPGTLMYECCLHTLRIFLLRMGWVGETGQVAYEPIPGVKSQLKCRGQVIESTKKVQYEITIKELGYRTDGSPYVLADSLMYADGRPVVFMKNMSLRMEGLTRDGLAALWSNREVGSARREPADQKTPIFDCDSITAFAIGNPSEAFGDRYKVFDKERAIARLPGPPYQFLDRITSIENCEQWKLAAGGIIKAEYDVPPDEWYFSQNRQPEMPFSVLLEIALQPCGWLAAYLGSALTSETDLSFRNLGGTGLQRLPVLSDTGTLTTTIKITRVSKSGGMIIENFDMKVECDEGVVYEGDTYFGFFSKAALADQVGIRDVIPFEPSAEERKQSQSFKYPTAPPFPDQMMRMVDKIEVFIPDGGPNGLGFIRGSIMVDESAWFFKAHFYQDPVWPGSLGLESFLQLVKFAAHRRWGDELGDACRFETMARDQKHTWIYRGQIIPRDKKVTVQAVITAIDDNSKTIKANGFLIVDGRIIYQMTDFAVRMSPA